MINGNAGNFIDELYYQDHYAIFRGDKLFFNGCQCKLDNDKKIVSATNGWIAKKRLVLNTS